MKIAAIVAMSENRVIGVNNDLPWDIPEDQKRFRELTEGGTVIMGRKCYDSIPAAVRPLPKRRNVVVTRDKTWRGPDNVLVFHDPMEAVNALKDEGSPSEILWIVGGGEIYSATLPCWDEVFLTVVHKHYDGDVFFPQFEQFFIEGERESHSGFSYIHYRRKPD